MNLEFALIEKLLLGIGDATFYIFHWAMFLDLTDFHNVPRPFPLSPKRTAADCNERRR